MDRASSPAPGALSRVLDATARCAMKYSLQRTTVEDIGREAGVSRATIYRYFPGGRDQIIAATVKQQIDEFFLGLADDIAGARGFEDLLVSGLMAAHRRLGEHELFHRVMAVEPEIVVPLVSTESGHVLDMIVGFLEPHVRMEVAAGTDDHRILATCDHIARLFLSHLEAPGSWSLERETEVRELVRSQFVGVSPGGGRGEVMQA